MKSSVVISSPENPTDHTSTLCLYLIYTGTNDSIASHPDLPHHNVYNLVSHHSSRYRLFRVIQTILTPSRCTITHSANSTCSSLSFKLSHLIHTVYNSCINYRLFAHSHPSSRHHSYSSTHTHTIYCKSGHFALHSFSRFSRSNLAARK